MQRAETARGTARSIVWLRKRHPVARALRCVNDRVLDRFTSPGHDSSRVRAGDGRIPAVISGPRHSGRALGRRAATSIGYAFASGCLLNARTVLTIARVATIRISAVGCAQLFPLAGQGPGAQGHREAM